MWVRSWRKKEDTVIDDSNLAAQFEMLFTSFIPIILIYNSVIVPCITFLMSKNIYLEIVFQNLCFYNKHLIPLGCNHIFLPIHTNCTHSKVKHTPEYLHMHCVARMYICGLRKVARGISISSSCSSGWDEINGSSPSPPPLPLWRLDRKGVREGKRFVAGWPMNLDMRVRGIAFVSKSWENIFWGLPRRGGALGHWGITPACENLFWNFKR